MQIEGRTAIDQQLAMTVVDHAAGAGNSLQPYPIILRQEGVTFALHQLQMHQARGQPDEHDGEQHI